MNWNRIARAVGMVATLGMVAATLGAPVAAAAPQEVGQVCVSHYTGEVRVGQCGPGTYPLDVDAAAPVKFTVNAFTGQVFYSRTGAPTGLYYFQVESDGGPSEGGYGVRFCQNPYTGELRYFWNGNCPNGYVPIIV